MAKTILPPGSYYYNPGAQQVDFTSFTASVGAVFDFSRLYAIIDVTTGVIIYTTSGTASGLGGSYSFPILTLTFDTTPFPGGDLQIIYDLPNAASATYDGTGTQPILSTTDSITGREGLDINLLNSTYGGQLGLPLPSYTANGYNSALSIGFVNSGNIVTPKMDPITNELIVQNSSTAIQSVNLSQVGASSVYLGQQPMTGSIPVALASDQTIDVNVAQSVSQDILGVAIGGNRNNQIEISFNSAPGPTLITNTFTGSGSVTVTNGHTIYQTGTTPVSSAKGVSVQTTTYRPAHEIYAAFTAAFLDSHTSSNQRIGLFDTNNGFFIGFSGNQFGVTLRNGGVDTFIPQYNFNTDDLLGGSTSKFTRNGIPEALSPSLSNLYRIRFAWLGSANIYYEVFSPDGEWVLFHNIRQPNSAYNPSIQTPNLPMTVEITKTVGSNNPSIATACWGAGTTSAYSPITATLTDNTLAAMTRSVITGVTTGGGGGYVNVKVNPSGALVTDSTISGTVTTSISGTVSTTLPDLFITGQAAQTAVINNIIPSTASASATDAAGYKSGSIQIVSTGTGGGFFFEQSNDNVNFQVMTVYNSVNINGSITTAGIVPTASQILYTFPITARYIRVRISSLITGGSIQAFTRLSQATWTPPVFQAVQNTGANLNVSAVIASGTVTTVSGVTTVSTVTSNNLASGSISDIGSGALTVSATSANILTTNTQAATFGVYVTAISGAGAAMDVQIQETLDATNYYTIYTFERITATGQYYSPCIKLSGLGLRYIRTVSGTTPSITNSVIRIQRSGQAETVKRFIDRTIDPNTLNSTTGVFFCEGAEDFNMIVRCTAQTTAATIALEFSIDNTNWFTSSSTVSTINGIVQSKTTNEQWKFVRAKVTSAGSGITLDSVTIGGHSA